MFSADRAVYHCGASSLCNRPGGAHRNRAVDDRELGLKEIDISSRLADKILDFERKAYMLHLDGPGHFRWRRDIDADRLMVLRN